MVALPMDVHEAVFVTVCHGLPAQANAREGGADHQQDEEEVEHACDQDCGRCGPYQEEWSLPLGSPADVHQMVGFIARRPKGGAQDAVLYRWMSR